MTDWRGIPAEYRNQIVTGDARELARAIPDESIDLVFTDPVYEKIEDYEWLAETAARVLKPDSAALVWCSASLMGETESVFRRQLEFGWWIDLIVFGGGAKMFSRNMLVKKTPLLWMNKGEFVPYLEIQDVKVCYYGSTKYPDIAKHKWAKHPDFMINYLQAFTRPGDIVYDPFTGGGTVLSCCVMLGRNFIASEIDPLTAENARERARLTQPPLPLVMPEQLEMSYE